MPRTFPTLIRRVSVADRERTRIVPRCTRPTGEFQVPPQARGPQEPYQASPLDRRVRGWPTSSRIRSPPSWLTCTGWSAGWRSRACWRSRRCWSSVCGDGNGVSGRSGLRGNRLRGLHPTRESRLKKLGPSTPRCAPPPPTHRSRSDISCGSHRFFRASLATASWGTS